MSKNRNLLIPALVYAAPFLAVFFLNFFVLHLHYFSTPTDTVPSFFGLGLNWINFAPKLIFHHPGYFFHELSFLLIKITGLPSNSLSAFNAAGVVINFLILAISSFWIAALAKKLAISNYVLFIIALFTASMPMVALTTSMWGVYFPIASLSVPSVLAIYSFVLQEENRYRDIFIPLASLGFIAGNLFFGLFLVGGAVLGILFVLNYKNGELLKKKLGLTFFKNGNYFLAKIIFYGLAAPLLSGWIIATNFFAPVWFVSAVKAFLFKGGADSGSGIVSNIHVVPFMLSSFWHWLIPIIFISIIFLVWKAFKTKSVENKFVAIFCLAAFVLNLVAAWGVSLKAEASWFAPKNFGQISRYFILLVAVAAVISVWIERSMGKKIKIFFLVFGFCIGFFSLVQFVIVLRPVVTAHNYADADIKLIVNNYLKNQPQGRVVCARTVVPEFCAVLYGYNNYRTAISIKGFSKEKIGENIFYSGDFDDNCGLPLGRCLGLGDYKGEVMVITEVSPNKLPAGAKVLWSRPDIETSIWLVKI